MALGNDNWKPSLLTSSLNKLLRGSTKARFIFLGKPPTLWWDLILEDGLPVILLLSIKSGYKVPWAKNFTSFTFFAYFSNNWIKSFPIIFLLLSGLEIFLIFLKIV